MEESILQSYDISPLEFQEALMSHQNNPALQQRIYMMQVGRERRCYAHWQRMVTPTTLTIV
jgi:hypothetical protein